MGEYSEKLVLIINELLHVVIVPTQRMYWPFLIGSLLLALIVLYRRQPTHGKNGRAGIRSALIHFFHPKVWAAPSATADYKLVIVKAGLRIWTGTFQLISAAAIALWIARLLSDSMGGLPQFNPMPVSIHLLYMFTLFVFWDFSRYLFHRLFHEVPFLWELHKVHHSAEVLTPATLYRSHPVEAVLYGLRGILVTGLVMGFFIFFFGPDVRPAELLGINALGFVLSLVGSNLRHSHIWLSYGPWLERIFISPAQHQIHHAQKKNTMERTMAPGFPFGML